VTIVSEEHNWQCHILNIYAEHEPLLDGRVIVTEPTYSSTATQLFTWCPVCGGMQAQSVLSMVQHAVTTATAAVTTAVTGNAVPLGSTAVATQGAALLRSTTALPISVTRLYARQPHVSGQDPADTCHTDLAGSTILCLEAACCSTTM
jgi:hypothetical protein